MLPATVGYGVAALRDHLAANGLQVEFGVEATAIVADNGGATVTVDKNGQPGDRSGRLPDRRGRRPRPDPPFSMQEHLDGENLCGGRFIVADVRWLALPAPCQDGRALSWGRAVSCCLRRCPKDSGSSSSIATRDDQGAEPPSAAKPRGAGQHPDRNRRRTTPTCAGLRTSRCTSALSQPSATAGAFCWATPGIFQARWAGEGINSALMDGADIAWKLALVLRGAAKPSLLQTYAIERGLVADRQCAGGLKRDPPAW